MDENQIPEIIHQIRRHLRLSQSELGKLIWPEKDPRITQSVISRYERGITDPPARVFMRICDLKDRGAPQ